MIEMNEPRLRAVLRIDAASGLLMGAPLALLPETLAPVLGLPAPLLLWAGIALFPVAATMLAAAATLARPLVVLIVWGNAAWVAASLATLFAFPATGIGGVVIVVQAFVVALFAWLENAGWARRAEGTAA